MRRQNVSQYRDFILACGHEIVANVEESDTVLLWTCAFREDIRDNSLAQIKYYQNECGKRVIVAGCLPDIDGKALAACFKGDVINWRQDVKKMAQIFGEPQNDLTHYSSIYAQQKFCDNSEIFRKKNPDKDVTFPDQFIKLVVAQGCNHKCSYCSERLVFPPYRSFPLGQLVEVCRALVSETNQTDVMLLADSVGEYGKDIGSSLPDLIRALCGIRSDIKIALNNLNLIDFIAYFADMRDFIKLGYIKHLNLPIQSASSRILKLMDREYSPADMHKVFSLLRELEFKDFDTHIIVGFPTETDSDFKETVDFILEYRPRYVLMNRYFEVSGIRCASLEGKVSAKDVTRRIDEAEKRFANAGVICNSENSELMKQRLAHINRSKL